jgi:hypothetical protein
MKQDNKTLLYVGGAVAAYFFILRPVLTKLGVFKSKEEKETEERKELQLQQQLQQVAASGQKLTKTVQEWQIIADAIYNDLRYSAVSDNKADAGYQVARVKNEADFWQLYKLFGKRREYLFGIPSGSLMDLQQFITSNLSKSAIATINDNYKRKNIKFRF